MAAEAIAVCAVPGSPLERQALFLLRVLRAGGVFFPASARTTMANYRKVMRFK